MDSRLLDRRPIISLPHERPVMSEVTIRNLGTAQILSPAPSASLNRRRHSDRLGQMPLGFGSSPPNLPWRSSPARTCVPSSSALHAGFHSHLYCVPCAMHRAISAGSQPHRQRHSDAEATP